MHEVTGHLVDGVLVIDAEDFHQIRWLNGTNAQDIHVKMDNSGTWDAMLVRTELDVEPVAYIQLPQR